MYKRRNEFRVEIRARRIFARLVQAPDVSVKAPSRPLNIREFAINPTIGATGLFISRLFSCTIPTSCLILPPIAS